MGVPTHTSGVLTLGPYSHARRGLVAVSFFAAAVSFFALRVTPGVVSLRYPSSLRRYPSSPLSCHARRGLVAISFFAAAVSFFAAAVSFFALIVSRPAWSRCGILLCCGGILLPPYRVTPGVVSLRYPSSLRRYPSSPLSCWGFLLVLVAAPGHGYREVGLWREIIDCVEKESPD